VGEGVLQPDHTVPAEVVAERLGSDAERGLSADVAAARLVDSGPDVLDPADPVRGWSRARLAGVCACLRAPQGGDRVRKMLGLVGLDVTRITMSELKVDGLCLASLVAASRPHGPRGVDEPRAAAPRSPAAAASSVGPDHGQQIMCSNK
jgi:hypothetical protein